MRKVTKDINSLKFNEHLLSPNNTQRQQQDSNVSKKTSITNERQSTMRMDLKTASADSNQNISANDKWGQF